MEVGIAIPQGNLVTVIRPFSHPASLSGVPYRGRRAKPPPSALPKLAEEQNQEDENENVQNGCVGHASFIGYGEWE